MKIIRYFGLIVLFWSRTAVGDEHMTMAAEMVQKAESEYANFQDGEFSATKKAMQILFNPVF